VIQSQPVRHCHECGIVEAMPLAA